MATKVYIVVTVKREDLDWTDEERDNLTSEVNALNTSKTGSGTVHAAAAELAKAIEADFAGATDGSGVEVVSHYFDIDG